MIRMRRVIIQPRRPQMMTLLNVLLRLAVLPITCAKSARTV